MTHSGRNLLSSYHCWDADQCLPLP